MTSIYINLFPQNRKWDNRKGKNLGRDSTSSSTQCAVIKTLRPSSHLSSLNPKLQKPINPQSTTTGKRSKLWIESIEYRNGNNSKSSVFLSSLFAQMLLFQPTPLLLTTIACSCTSSQDNFPQIQATLHLRHRHWTGHWWNGNAATHKAFHSLGKTQAEAP